MRRNNYQVISNVVSVNIVYHYVNINMYIEGLFEDTLILLKIE